MLGIVAILVLLLAAWPGEAAATTPRPKGVTLSPAFQQVSISQDQDTKDIPFSVTNNQAVTQQVKITFSDFNTLGDTGGLFFVGSNPTQLQKKYGLSDWISIASPELSLKPGQKINLNAVVQNLPSLAPGGHYGAINVELENGAKGSSTNRVGVSPVASTLIFLTKLGGDTHRLKLLNVSAGHTFLNLPSSVNLRFYNDGNTHLVPRGIANITNSSGKIVSSGIINQNSEIILPQTSRVFVVPLTSQAVSLVPGSYRLTVNFRFDGLDQYRTYRTNFFYLPVIYLLVLALIIAAVIAALIRWRKKRPPKKRVVRIIVK